ncbi:MAG: hypothetical protein ABFD65_05635, partial [Candidatus Polarisedimenticolia bacterium]
GKAVERATDIFRPASIPYDPVTGARPRAKDERAAASFLQDQARAGVEGPAKPNAPQTAADAIRAGMEEFAAMGAPAPTSGLLSNNPGVVGVDMAARQQNRAPFISRDNAVRDYSVGEVDSLRPAGANPELPVETITQQAQTREAQALRTLDETSARLEREVQAADARVAELRQQIEAAQVQTAERIRQLMAQADDASVQEANRIAGLRQQAEQQAQQAERRAEELRQQAEGVRGQREELAQSLRATSAQNAPAAQGIDTAVVDQTLRPMNAEKRALFNAAEGQDLTVPGEDLAAAVQAIRARADAVLPGLEGTRLPGQLDAVLAGITRQLEGEDAAGVSFDRMNQSRGPLNDLANQARAAGQYQLAESIDVLRAAIGRETDALAGISPEVGAAVDNFRQNYAPVWSRGPGDEATKFRRDYNADPVNRTKTPPSQTAGRFLQPTQPERADALARILEASPEPEAARATVRDYLLSDLAATAGVVATNRGGDSVINLNAMRKWRENWSAVLDRFPGVGEQADEMIRRVQRSDDMGRAVASEIKAHEQATQQQKQRGREEIRTAEQENTAAAAARRKGIEAERQRGREEQFAARKGMDAEAAQGQERVAAVRGERRAAQRAVE